MANSRDTPSRRIWPHLALIVIALMALGGKLSATTATAAEDRQTDSAFDQDVAAEAASMVEARDPEAWPRVLEEGEFRIEIYPPRIESWDGQSLRAQAAVTIGEKDKEGETYGMIEFIARTRVDKDARLVVIDEYQGMRAKLPSAPDREARLLGILQRQLNEAVRVIYR